MSILKVARMGNPVLRKVARDLTVAEIHSPEIGRLIQDMVETMHEQNGIGLAAPQVHQSVSLAIIEFEEDNDRYPDMGSQKLDVYINPKITVLDPKQQAHWEGCLSIPELKGLVHRPRKIRVDYLDREAKSRSIVAEGFLATVFQHELDHLAGKLFIDRMSDLSKLSFMPEYQRYWEPSEDDDEGDLGD